MSIHASAYGRLGRDPRAITTASGKGMASASIACDVSSQRDQDGTHWLPLLAFGGQAETLLKHQQGDMIAATGRMQRNVWTDKEGVQHVDLQLIVDTITSARTVRPGAKRAKRTAPAGGKDGGSVRDDYRDLARPADHLDDEIGF